MNQIWNFKQICYEQQSLLNSNFSTSQWEGKVSGEWYIKPRSLHWWNHYIFEAKCDDKQFRSIFRLPYVLFQFLCESLYEDLKQGDIPLSLSTSIKSRVILVEKQVVIAILWLSSCMAMINISELFRCGKSKIARVVIKFINAMHANFRNYIQWPSD